VGKPGSGVKIGQRAHLELHRGLKVAGGVREDDSGRCVRAREQQLLRPDPRACEQRAPGRERPGAPLPLGLHPEGRCTTRRALQRIERRWKVVRVDADDPQVVERAIACDEKERREILAQQLETQLHVAGEPSAASACNRAHGYFRIPRAAKRPLDADDALRRLFQVLTPPHAHVLAAPALRPFDG
jgi:hypothetical protein